MKKLCLYLLLASLVAACCGCGSNSASTAATAETTAETTEAETTVPESTAEAPACPGTLYSAVRDVAIVDGFADIENSDNEQCHAMEGMAVLGDYAYCVKVNKSNSQAIFFRVDLNTGAVDRMHEPDGTEFVDYIGHGNDIMAIELYGEQYLFVSHTSSGENAVIVLKIDGTTYTHVADVKTTKALHGLDPFSLEGDELRLVAMYAPAADGIRSYTYYECILDVSFLSNGAPADGTLLTAEMEVKKLGKIDVSSLWTDSGFQNLSGWACQGLTYRDGRIYLPITKSKTTVIAVYPVVDEASKLIEAKKLAPATDLYFCLHSGDFNFEVESVGFWNGQMVVNSNRTKDGVRLNDGVHIVEGFLIQ